MTAYPPNLLDALPPELRHLASQLGLLAEKQHLRAAIVGGTIRDLLLGMKLDTNAELDVVVEGDALAFAEQLARCLHGTLHQHPAFMTARIDWIARDNTPRHMDVVTARTEQYPFPGALPVVRRASLEEDLARRDFTVNAMAIRLDLSCAGQLLDPFGGQHDLRMRQLRVLHDKSFEDDPTRMFRAARFAARCNLILEKDTALQLNRSLSGLNRLSRTRIRHELALVAAEQHPVPCLITLADWNVLNTLHPDLQLSPSILTTLHRLLSPAYVQRRSTAADPFLLLAYAILSNLPENILPEAGHRIGLSDSELNKLLKALSAFKNFSRSKYGTPDASGKPVCLSTVYELVVPLSSEGQRLFEVLAGGERCMPVEQIIQRGKSMPVSGRDLLLLGIPAGPACGQQLNALRTAWIEGTAANRDELLAIARNLAHLSAAEVTFPPLQDLHPGQLPCTKERHSEEC